MTQHLDTGDPASPVAAQDAGSGAKRKASLGARKGFAFRQVAESKRKAQVDDVKRRPAVATFEMPATASDARKLAAAFLAPFEGVDLPIEETRPQRNAASEVLRLWETRLRNTVLTGRAIQGAAELVDELRKIPADAAVEQFGFSGSKRTANVFFDAATRALLGSVVVEQ